MSLYSEHAQNVNRITAYTAALEADRIRRRGDLVGGTITMLGQVPLQILDARAQQQQAQVAGDRDALDRMRKLAADDLHGEDVRSQIAGRNDEQARADHKIRTEEAARRLGLATPDNYAPLRKSVVALRPDLDEALPPEFPGLEVIQGLQRTLVGDLGKMAEPVKPPESYTLGPGMSRFGPDNKPVASVPVTERPDPAAAGFTLTPGAKRYDAQGNEIASVPDRPVAPGRQTDTSGDDVKLAVQAMKEGTVPPQLPGRASKEYIAMLAEAKRQNYDLAGAATDWAATQKHLATMNGAQQLRLNQTVNALPELLDSVEVLADKWKGGRFPILNKANLALAESGAYGNEAASLAKQLKTQIADVTADLGNVYMGGNSPTDHALQLAGTALSADWSEKVLRDMIALARKNVTIRRNSINNTGVAGASSDNPYMPTRSTGTIRARDSQGNLHEAPAGTALPSGWVLEP